MAIVKMDADIMQCDKEKINDKIAEIEVYTIRVGGVYGCLPVRIDAGEGLIFEQTLATPEGVILYCETCQDVLKEFKK